MNLEKQKENFKNHRAIFKDLGNIKMIEWYRRRLKYYEM
jgi:hypothetical protein